MLTKAQCNTTERLNQKNKELVQKMDELGFTSLGHEGTYLIIGRTIFMKPRICATLGNEKIATFTRATLHQVEEKIINDIENTIKYFQDVYDKKITSTKLEQAETTLMEIYPSMTKSEGGVLEINILNHTVRLLSVELGNSVVLFKNGVNMFIDIPYDKSNRTVSLAFYFSIIEHIENDKSLVNKAA